jgi:hypothetical protein
MLSACFCCVGHQSQKSDVAWVGVRELGYHSHASAQRVEMLTAAVVRSIWNLKMEGGGWSVGMQICEQVASCKHL